MFWLAELILLAVGAISLPTVLKTRPGFFASGSHELLGIPGDVLACAGIGIVVAALVGGFGGIFSHKKLSVEERSKFWPLVLIQAALLSLGVVVLNVFMESALRLDPPHVSFEVVKAVPGFIVVLSSITLSRLTWLIGFRQKSE